MIGKWSFVRVSSDFLRNNSAFFNTRTWSTHTLERCLCWYLKLSVNVKSNTLKSNLSKFDKLIWILSFFSFKMHTNRFLITIYIQTIFLLTVYGVLTLRNFLSPGFALGQNNETAASRSPDSWQHIHDRSICQILLPDTLNQIKHNAL